MSQLVSIHKKLLSISLLLLLLGVYLWLGNDQLPPPYEFTELSEQNEIHSRITLLTFYFFIQDFLNKNTTLQVM